MKKTKIETEIEQLKEMFRRASNARGHIDKHRETWEAFYWNDVEDTKSQFTNRQNQEIASTYDIPLSTKIAYPIIEQMLSFLTGSKPFPRLVGSTNADAEYAAIYAEAYKAVWYESKSKRELRNALRDMLVVGTGFMRVRTNSMFNETTFNVVHEYVRWKHVYVDPQSRKEDLSDAEFLIIATPMPKKKAEKKYNIKLSDNATGWENSIDGKYLDDVIHDSSAFGYRQKNRQVLVKEYFVKEEKNVYLSENGDIGLQKPKVVEIPNEEKIKLGQHIQQLKQYLAQISQSKMETNAAIASNAALLENPAVPEVKDEIGHDEQYREQGRQLDTEIAEVSQELKDASIAFGQMPDTVPAYKLINEKDEEIICFDPVRIRKLRTKYTLLVEDEIVEQRYLPIENNSIIAFTLQHAGHVNATYGIMHYISDMEKFLNKVYSMLIYDMMTHARPKILYPKGAIHDQKMWEDSYSLPSAMLEYEPNPQLPNAGRPEMIAPMPLSQVITFVIQQMTQLIEYVTGVHGALMGDPSSMPNTASATSSMQNLGTQRIKLYARNIEPSLELLAATTVEYIQQYAPKEKQLLYLDDKLKEQAVVLIQSKEDVKFRVRVDVVNDLPTVRQQMATMLGVIAGQTGSPYVADALVKQMIKMLDLPEFTSLVEDMDMMKQLQAQNEQLTEQLKLAESQIKVFQYNKVQNEAKVKADKDRAMHQVDMEKEKIALKQEQKTPFDVDETLNEF